MTLRPQGHVTSWVSSPYHKSLQKRIFWKKIFPNMMKKRKDFSSKSGVKFRFISNHVITFSVGGFGFTSGIICCV